MGASGSSVKSKQKHGDDALKSFGVEELEKWKQCFNEINRGSPSKKKNDGFNENQFSEYTKSILTEKLQKGLMAAFLGNRSGSHPDSSNNVVPFDAFIRTISQLIKSDSDERAQILSLLCGGHDGNVTKAQLTDTLKNLFTAYVSAESKTAQCGSWRFKSASDESISTLVSYFLKELLFDDHDRVSTDAFARWVRSNSILTRIIDLVIYAAFRFEIQRDPDEGSYFPWTIPSCDELDWSKFQTLMTVPTLLLLNYHIPNEYRRQWRLLYTTSMYGESFSTLVKQIAGKGPTILIMKDENGSIFGGFNSTSWSFSSNFLGDASCFVFSLHPTLAIYSPTGYNTNYCYLNSNQQTLPNGLGFGGQVQVNDQPVHYFSLWLDSDFGKGSSKGGCTTFNSPRLSGEENFKIHSLEVWAVEPISDAVHKGKVAKSILDIDPEARAILEMTGKTRASDGLREPHPDDDE